MHQCCFGEAQKGTWASVRANSHTPFTVKNKPVINPVFQEIQEISYSGDKNADKDPLMKIRQPLLLPQYMEEDQSVDSTSFINKR